ncbi:MAG: GntR family transcriptional regulator, partial [Propionibacterium sp.]
MIVIDQKSSTPPFEQIKAQITSARESGEFPAGYRLLPVRRLAAQLGVATNTVARAYRELEACAIIETRGRNGSFVTGSDENLEAAAAAAREYLDKTRDLGITPEVAV